MTLFNLYVFDRGGTCIFYREWKREKPAGISRDETSTNQLNYYETTTGMKFIMNTDRNATGIQDLLKQIYAQVYVETIVKNPLLKAGEEITSELFKAQVDELAQRHPSFT